MQLKDMRVSNTSIMNIFFFLSQEWMKLVRHIETKSDGQQRKYERTTSHPLTAEENRLALPPSPKQIS